MQGAQGARVQLVRNVADEKVRGGHAAGRRTVVQANGLIGAIARNHRRPLANLEVDAVAAARHSKMRHLRQEVVAVIARSTCSTTRTMEADSVQVA